MVGLFLGTITLKGVALSQLLSSFPMWHTYYPQADSNLAEQEVIETGMAAVSTFDPLSFRFGLFMYTWRMKESGSAPAIGLLNAEAMCRVFTNYYCAVPSDRTVTLSLGQFSVVPRTEEVRESWPWEVTPKGLKLTGRTLFRPTSGRIELDDVLRYFDDQFRQYGKRKRPYNGHPVSY